MLCTYISINFFTKQIMDPKVFRTITVASFNGKNIRIREIPPDSDDSELSDDQADEKELFQRAGNPSGFQLDFDSEDEISLRHLQKKKRRFLRVAKRY
ncbi:hypothetical protein JTB14_023596 [Gonioctena quinquepunctata]|nr:hypothetical protein JTB14_023596 [Gonioctena quinquepunctata]